MSPETLTIVEYHNLIFAFADPIYTVLIPVAFDIAENGVRFDPTIGRVLKPVVFLIDNTLYVPYIDTRLKVPYLGVVAPVYEVVCEICFCIEPNIAGVIPVIAIFLLNKLDQTILVLVIIDLIVLVEYRGTTLPVVLSSSDNRLVNLPVVLGTLTLENPPV